MSPDRVINAYQQGTGRWSKCDWPTAFGRSGLDLNGLESSASSVLAEEVPGDVVTMNSTVEVCDLDGGETETFTLAYPDDADISRGRMSVLAPLGRALLGRRVGEVVQVAVPAGPRRIRIERLRYQP
jgi:regulator of nucleoside diphosphate kinase